MKAGTLSGLTAIAAVAAAASLAACNQRSPGSASNTSPTDTYSRSTDSTARASPSTGDAAPSDPSTAPSSMMASNSATAAPGTSVVPKSGPIGVAPDDTALNRQVKTALASEPALRSQSINVDSRNATVTLTGAVDSAASKARANEVAAGVNGVVAVVDHLTIKTS